MLSRNDQLVMGGQGRQQRSRGTTYVNDPPFGFFIAGSTVKTLNGVYTRRNTPRSVALARAHEDILLYYTHMDSGSLMLLSQKKRAAPAPAAGGAGGYEDEDDYEDEERDVWGHVVPPVRQWLLVDERSVDRFSHVGDTIVPGAGVRWKHVHSESGAAGGSRAAGWLGSFAVTPAVEDDMNQLPWQVIAILDMSA
jgi:hypothetical protein